jgi:hypothetical protein
MATNGVIYVTLIREHDRENSARIRAITEPPSLAKWLGSLLAT